MEPDILTSHSIKTSAITGGGAGESAPPRDFFLCEEKKENCKREGGKLKMEGGKVTKEGEDLFFLFLFFFWFVSHFSKPLKFVLDLPKWKFSTGKKHFTLGKNLKKLLCPLRKMFLLCPWSRQENSEIFWYQALCPAEPVSCMCWMHATGTV